MSDFVQQAERMRPRLRGFFRHNKCRDVDDLTQETLTRVWGLLAKGRLNYGANPDSLYFAVARNVMYEYFRAHQHDGGPLDEEMAGGERARGSAASLERRVLVGEYLDRMAPGKADLLVQFFAAGPEATRDALGITAGTLRQRVHRALNALRDKVWKLESRGGV